RSQQCFRTADIKTRIVGKFPDPLFVLSNCSAVLTEDEIDSGNAQERIWAGLVQLAGMVVTLNRILVCIGLKAYVPFPHPRPGIIWRNLESTIHQGGRFARLSHIQ